LAAAAPPGRLSYEPEVFLAGDCLSPASSGCGTVGRAESARRSASEALLEAGREPRLELDMAVLLDIGAAVTARHTSSSALPR
jgi:hypothetical protein